MTRLLLTLLLAALALGCAPLCDDGDEFVERDDDVRCMLL